MHYKIDQYFIKYFKNLKQVFLYVLDECDLNCVQCLYKADILFSIKKKQIELEECLKLISDFREMGAIKLTIMGGEPTLYGKDEGWRPLLELISKAKEIGYKYVRIDTNGQFDEKLLYKEDFKKLDEVTFSLDGPLPEINDPLRGEGSFDKCVSNIKKAISLGYNVDITCCIHRGLIQRDNNGDLFLHRMIKFSEEIGISRLNFHDLFKYKIPRDLWTGSVDINLGEWFDTWLEIQKKVDVGKYKIPVRIPQCFTSQKEFSNNSSYYGYCSAKLGERVLVHPNGIIRICSLMIGTPFGVAKYYDDKIEWDHGYTNELHDHEKDVDTPCTNQVKGNAFEHFLPLCVSFKPKQNEIIWGHKLEWEKLRNNKVEN